MISGGQIVPILTERLLPEQGEHANMFYVWSSRMCSGTLLPTCNILPQYSRSSQLFRRTHGNFREEPIKAKHRLQDFNTLAVALRYSFLTDERELSINIASVNPVQQDTLHCVL